MSGDGTRFKVDVNAQQHFLSGTGEKNRVTVIFITNSIKIGIRSAIVLIYIYPVLYLTPISCYLISYYLISYHIFSYHTISSYYIILSHIILPHIISYHIISYHIISYHIISYYLISYYLIKFHLVLSSFNYFFQSLYPICSSSFLSSLSSRLPFFFYSLSSTCHSPSFLLLHPFFS